MSDALLAHAVNFDQSDAGRVMGTTHNGGVVASWQSGENGRFALITRGQTARGDLRCLGVLPVVVRGDDRTVVVVQFKH